MSRDRWVLVCSGIRARKLRHLVSACDNPKLKKHVAMRKADDLLKMWADADVIRHTNMTILCTRGDVENRIKRFQHLDVFAVTQEGEVVGIVGCSPVRKEKQQFGLFYQFCKSSWGQGKATIATKWLLDY